MKWNHFSSAVLALCVLTGFGMAEENKLLEDLSLRANKFAADLFKTLAKQNEGSNVLVSPISAEVALAEAYLGAGGNTAKEMLNVLHLSEDRSEHLNGHKQLIQTLQKPVLKLATKLYVEKTFEVNKDFKHEAEEFFLSAVDEVDFEKNYEKARGDINAWVEKQTNDKIKELLAQGVLDARTKLVIVNALHFKDNWKNKFMNYDTYKQPFYLTPTKTADVEMMHTTDYFNYRHDTEAGFKILELPYEHEDFRMVVVLPDDKDGLKTLLDKAPSLFNVPEQRSKLQRTRVAVSLPKFKVEQKIEMNDLLKQMGMKDLFEEQHANLTGITTKENLYVSKVVQKVFIEVNEEGTEAAAATGLVIRPVLAPAPGFNPEEFIADHPFSFALIHKNIMLFIGNMNNF